MKQQKLYNELSMYERFLEWLEKLNKKPQIQFLGLEVIRGSPIKFGN